MSALCPQAADTASVIAENAKAVLQVQPMRISLCPPDRLRGRRIAAPVQAAALRYGR
jgi:hypothetical protein